MPERAERVAQVEVGHALQLVAQRLQRRERDVGAHHVVRALEDREDPDVAHDLLVGLVAHVALPALELHGAVGLVPDELGAGDLAHGRLERVVLDAAVDEAGRQVGHRLEAEEVGDHPADLVLDHVEVGERRAELAAVLDVVDGQVDEALGQADRPRPEREPPVVEDLHGDPEAVARLAEEVLRRHPHVVEAQAAQVVAAQAHRVVALADLEALHVGGDDERDVLVLAVDLGAGEGHERRGARAVADVALLAVQDPRAVGLELGAGLDVEGVGARARLGEREGGELATARQVGQEARLLLVVAEEDDPLHADRLMHPEGDGERAVGLADAPRRPARSPSGRGPAPPYSSGT